MATKKKTAAKKRPPPDPRSFRGAMERIRAHARSLDGSRPKGVARLTPDEVRAIRCATENKELSIRELANVFQVTHGTICHVIKRRTYKEVD